MPIWYRLLPAMSVIDKFSQAKYRKVTKKLLLKSGVHVDGLPLWISPRAYFDISNAGSIMLGDGCVISHYVSLLTHDFSMDRAAVHLLDSLPEDSEYYRIAPIVIGQNSFIGLHSIVLPGVTVGPGAIVGAGSVVTKDVPENGIVAGNPARLIGYTTTDLEKRLQKYSVGERRR